MFLKGKIIEITPNETMPDDSDTDIQNTNQKSLQNAPRFTMW
jgi:hypothetical protein